MEFTHSKRSLSDQAYEHIKNMILNLEVRPGERIPEEGISGYLGSSRTPVREALRRLANDGLVTLYPNRFAEVSNYDKHTVQQIGVLRLSYDILSAQLAIRNAKMDDLQRLCELARECERGAARGNMYERIKLDCEFHRGITAISSNRVLIQSVEALYLRIYLIQVTKYTSVEASLKQIESHGEMIESIAKRDVRTTQNLICEYLKDFFDIEQGIIDNYMVK
jgi:DNA-binding GntR family transcriptional regulator